MTGLVRLACAAFAALALGAGGPRALAAEGVTGAFELPPRPVWAGQVFDLTLAWRVDWTAFGNMDGPLDWTSAPLVTEPWAEPALRDTPAGAGFATIAFRTRAMALQPGKLTLQPARQVMVMRTGAVRMGDYERAITAPVPVESARAVLEVRPLPPAPAGFSGAVGRFTLTSSVDHTTLKVGEEVTWTLALAGEGNWPAVRGVPARQASRDFDLLGAPRVTETAGASLFERTRREVVTLVPRRAGRYVLGAVQMAVFDPQAGGYVSVRAPALTLDIQPGPDGAGTAAPAPPAMAAPDALPPLLAGAAHATSALPQGAWILALASGPVLLLGLWLLLALRRAYLQDPARVARAADARLQTTLTRLVEGAEGAEQRRLVRAWQRDVPLRLSLDLAAPAPRSFADPAWSRLWAEADRFLYGRDGVLPMEWAPRARALWRKLPTPPPFAPATMFRRASLLPTLCILVLALGAAAPPAPATAQEATEAAFRGALNRDPLDWRARHNLAVTLAARDRWDEAAGHAAVAWVQHPAAPETRDLWLLTARKAGYSLEPGASVPRPRGLQGRALALASPVIWRWIALAMAWLAVGGGAMVLLARFGQIDRRLAPVGLAMVLAAACGGAAATAALVGYGSLGRRDAVLLWRAAPLRPLPVDTPAEMAPAQMAAGTPGRVDRTFLGWRRVRFAGGQVGWLRPADLIAVWGRGEPRPSEVRPPR